MGYPVGRVVSVDHQSRTRFIQVNVAPAAHLNRAQQVLLAWPKQAALRKAVMLELSSPLVPKGVKK